VLPVLVTSKLTCTELFGVTEAGPAWKSLYPNVV
jgi:hypothetical protein